MLWFSMLTAATNADRGGLFNDRGEVLGWIGSLVSVVLTA